MNSSSFDLTADQSVYSTCSSVLDTAHRVKYDYDIEAPEASDDQTDKLKILLNLFWQSKFYLLIEYAKTWGLDQSDSIMANNILGEAHAEVGNQLLAVYHFGKALHCQPKHSEIEYKKTIKPYIHNNISLSHRKLGMLNLAEKHLRLALESKPNFAEAYNNLGCIFNDKAMLSEAEYCFLEAIKLNPKGHDAYWNLHSLSTDTATAKEVLLSCLRVCATFQPAIITLAGLNALDGRNEVFEKLLDSALCDDPVLQSFNWLFSKKPLPTIYFNRWDVFDHAVEMAVKGRPCYEFGVWMGASLTYLMKNCEKGFGFDTFEGLPERWRTISEGTYSSFSQIPEIPDVEFIVGNFEETLPTFFGTPKPKAGIINFDADLYSSTLCALENAAKVIDEKTVLIFDEMIVNHDWQKDEFCAFNKFCETRGYSYEVIAASTFTKQVACQIRQNGQL